MDKIALKRAGEQENRHGKKNNLFTQPRFVPKQV